MILDFFGISIRASRFFRVLPKLRGMAVYRTLEVETLHETVLGCKKSYIGLARKEEFLFRHPK